MCLLHVSRKLTKGFSVLSARFDHIILPVMEIREITSLFPAVLFDTSKTEASKRSSEFVQPIKTKRGNLKVSGHSCYTRRSQGFQCSAGTSSRDDRVPGPRQNTRTGGGLTTAVFLVAGAIPGLGLEPNVGSLRSHKASCQQDKRL